MKKPLVATIVSFCCVVAFGTATRAAEDDDKVREDLAHSIGVQAYIYGYPVMDLYRTFYEGTLDPKRGHNVTLNQFNFSRKLVTPKDDWVVTPNNDTIYNRAFLDLSHEPMVLRIPDTGTRNYWFPLGDIYHNLNASISWDTLGFKGGEVALVPPGWQGVLPKGVRRVEVRTPMVWLLGRYAVDGKPADLAEANALQDKTSLIPLSQYGAEKPQPQKIDPANYPVFRQADLTDARKFFTTLNEMLRRNSPQPGDAILINLMSELGLHPDQKFDWDALDPPVRNGLTRAAKDAHAIVTARTKSFARKVNGWVEVIMDADMSDQPVNHAGLCMMGLLYSQKEVSTYHVGYFDGDGVQLSGEHRYKLTFKKPPPVKAFWSLTMYDSKTRRYIENPIDRWAIGDRTEGLVYGDDGSLTITISAAQPKDEKERANWLPAPKDTFYVVLREYSPDPAILTREWEPPGIQMIK